MRGTIRRWAVLFTIISAFLLGGAVAAAETVIKVDSFVLVPPEGPTVAVPFQINQPGTVILEVTTAKPMAKIGIIARGANSQTAPARKDGATPLRLEFQVTRQSLSGGNTWYAFPTLLAPNKSLYPVSSGMAVGQVKVSFIPQPGGTAVPIGERAPPPRIVGTVMTPPLQPGTIAAPPPPALGPPPGGKKPPPGYKPPPPPVTGSAGPPSVPPPPPPGSAPPRPPLSGRYRVTINGIHVNHATWDTMLQTDGKGDEIFLVVDTSDLNTGGGPGGNSSAVSRAISSMVGPTRTVTSKVYGDTNSFPSRIRAGSMSNQGGIQSGDDIPGPSPWSRLGSPQPDRFPLLVWEGTLVDGQSGVLIVPAIWEQDSTDRVASVYNSAAEIWGSTLKPMWDLWNSGLMDPTAMTRLLSGGLGIAISTQMNNLIGKLIPGVSLNPMDWITNWLGAEITKVVGESKDRPIGMTEGGGGYVFVPQVITLTYRTAEAAVAPNALQRGPGVLELRYIDAARLAGDYSLYVQIEKIQ